MTPLAIVVCPGPAPEWAGAGRDHLPHLPSVLGTVWLCDVHSCDPHGGQEMQENPVPLRDP